MSSWGRSLGGTMARVGPYAAAYGGLAAARRTAWSQGEARPRLPTRQRARNVRVAPMGFERVFGWPVGALRMMAGPEPHPGFSTMARKLRPPLVTTWSGASPVVGALGDSAGGEGAQRPARHVRPPDWDWEPLQPLRGLEPESAAAVEWLMGTAPDDAADAPAPPAATGRLGKSTATGDQTPVPPVPGQAKPLVVNRFTIVDAAHPIEHVPVAVIGHHPDDAGITAGLLASVVSPGWLHYVKATDGRRAQVDGCASQAEVAAIRDAEARREAAVAGAHFAALDFDFYRESRLPNARDVQRALDWLQAVHPQILVVTHPKDRHHTHLESTRTFLLAVRALMTMDPTYRPEIWLGETPWGPHPPGSFNTIVAGSEQALQNKLAQIRAHKSQIDRTPFDRLAEGAAVVHGTRNPELCLSELGADPVELDKYQEVYCRVLLGSADDAERLARAFDHPPAPVRAAPYTVDGVMGRR